MCSFVTVFGYQTKYIVYWFWISNKTKFLLEFELVLEIKLNRFWILDYWTLTNSNWYWIPDKTNL